MSVPAAFADGPFTDDELTALALAADADVEVGDDAVCLWDLTPSMPAELLPLWYMPSAATGSRALQGWSRHVALLIVATIVLINACGLCVTYGWVTLG